MVAVVGLAIGHGELLRLDDRVRAVGGRRVEQLVGKRVEQCEHLEQRRALPPGAGLGDGVPAELHGRRRLERPVAVGDQAKAGVCAADIPDEDRKGYLVGCDWAGHWHCEIDACHNRNNPPGTRFLALLTR